MLEKRESSEVEELYSSWSLFIVCVLLILSLWTSYYLQIKKIRAIHETVVSIFAGMIVGLVVRLAPGHLIREMLSFNHTLFFNLLLPPIILNSGYEMRQDNFFRNFGSILTFAFLGTFIAAVGLGSFVYVWALLGLEGLNLSILDCLVFGSTLSATDPVTILSVFTQYKVDPKLYSIIFGESLLNDARNRDLHPVLFILHGHGSCLWPVYVARPQVLASFTLPINRIVSHRASRVHFLLFSNGLHMSGIVSLLFCGITLKHYAYHTMSRRTQRTTKYLFAVLAQLSENFIFIYLGLNLFTREFAVFKPLFILISTIAVVATRYLAVFPLSEVINLFHRWRGQRRPELPHSYQMMLFWAGLRGAVGVALAAGFTGPNQEALRTTVLVVVVLTVIMFGGTTARMLEVMGVRTGVEEGEESSSDEEERAWLRSGRTGPPGARWDPRARNAQHVRRWSRSNPNGHTPNARTFSGNSGSTFDVGSSDSEGNEVLPMSRNNYYNHHQQSQTDDAGNSSTSLRQAGEAWFHAIDERYLLPLFSNAVASRKFHARRATRRATVASGTTNPRGQPEDYEYESYPDSPAEAPSPSGSLSTTDRVTGAVKRKNQEVLRSIGSFWRGSPARSRDPGTSRDQLVGSSSPAQDPHALGADANERPS
ncbi:probable NHX1-Na+/H+ exchanger of the prevacuolar compartment-involved in salt tolerance [Serendipita indica DSM 11827]|uniref:Probable NHX1-Na+/H+ exchanger of the prevacuolar compartment-involved in salt tolerance n=1 Tax=Serendipita indica (strain DSM 11827) TaxID=1109443 RepID=G4TDB0_SERID|nr:probable NHX1-Na+/H+ exchanger of the prevacuolar compartment-involved in salt tolerance [Serendipita indica DSM 11827]